MTGLDQTRTSSQHPRDPGPDWLGFWADILGIIAAVLTIIAFMIAAWCWLFPV